MLYAILCYDDEEAVGSWTKEQDAEPWPSWAP